MKTRTCWSLTLLAALLFFASCTGTRHTSNADTDGLQVLPLFIFTSFDGEIFDNANLQPDKKILFYYLDPECGYCRSQSIWLKNNMNNLMDVHIIMISPAERSKTFAIVHSLGFDNYANVSLLYDPNNEFAKQFQVQGAPYMLLYDENFRRVASFEGLTEMYYLNSAIGSLQ